MKRVGVGDTLASYRIESAIAHGGMGAVYLAEDVKLGRKVALKVLAADLADDPVFRERFVRESRIAAALDHPHIIPIYEADEADGHLFIAMRYVRGTDLESLIASAGPLPLARTSTIIGQIASALDAAHGEGLVHRDVKPANILVSPGTGPGATDYAYLSDFGISKRLSYSSEVLTGDVIGTVDYIAPEQIEGKPVDGRADVYSLGCVVYQCLSGRVPFPRSDDVAVLWAHVREHPPRVTATREDVSPELDRIVAKAMAKSPDGRYQSCGDLASAIQAAVPIAVVPHRRRTRRRRAILAAVVGFAVLAAAATAVLLDGGHSTRLKVMSIRSIDPDGTVPHLTNQVVRLPSGASGLAVYGGGVWAITPSSIIRVDPETPATTTRHLPFEPRRIIAGDAGLFVAGATASGRGELERVDPSTGEPLWRTTLPFAPGKPMAIGSGGVWLLGNGILWEFGLKGGVYRGNVPAPGAVSFALGDGVAWYVEVADHSYTLHRVNLATRNRVLVASLQEPPWAMTVADGLVWVAERNNNLVVSIDPSTRQVSPGVQTGIQPHSFATTPGHVWVAEEKAVCDIPTAGPVLSCRHVTVARTVVAIAAAPNASTNADVWILVASNSPS